MDQRPGSGRGFDHKEATDAGLSGSHRVTARVKRLRLNTPPGEGPDLQSGLEELVLDCEDCGREVHWVSGMGVEPGHWEAIGSRHRIRTQTPTIKDRGFS